MKAIIVKSIFLSLIFVFASLISGNVSAQDMVFITKNGTKYHKKDCQHVKGKADASSVALTKAKTDKLEACKVCFADAKTAPTTEDKKTTTTTNKTEKKDEKKTPAATDKKSTGTKTDKTKKSSTTPSTGTGGK